MSTVSKIKRNFGVHLGMWSITLCLVMGLIMKIRPFVILERTFISFVISATFGYLLVSVIERYSRSKEKVHKNVINR